MPETDFAGMAAALEAVRDNPAPVLVVTHEWPDGDAVGSACANVCVGNRRKLAFVLHEVDLAVYIA